MRFRFDANRHEYIDLDTGQVLPHITGMLDAAGLVDDRWFTEESRIRGSIVHRLTADYDLGALDPATCQSEHRNYLLAHVEAMELLGRPDWLHVEEPTVHNALRFGGRPDRVGALFGAISDVEIKAAIPQRSHEIQTALQCILIAPEVHLPPEAIVRYALYLKPNGKFKLERHSRRADFDEARRIIRQTCRRAA